MYGLKFLKHLRMFYFKTDILLEMLIWKNDITYDILKEGVLSG